MKSTAILPCRFVLKQNHGPKKDAPNFHGFFWSPFSHGQGGRPSSEIVPPAPGKRPALRPSAARISGRAPSPGGPADPPARDGLEAPHHAIQLPPERQKIGAIGAMVTITILQV